MIAVAALSSGRLAIACWVACNAVCCALVAVACAVAASAAAFAASAAAAAFCAGVPSALAAASALTLAASAAFFASSTAFDAAAADCVTTGKLFGMLSCDAMLRKACTAAGALAIGLVDSEVELPTRPWLTDTVPRLLEMSSPP